MSCHFRTIVCRTVMCLPLLTSAMFAADAPSPAPKPQPNAMFKNNDLKNKEMYGVWIREARGSCEEQREKDRSPLCLGMVQRGPGKYERKDMKYCFRLSPGNGLDHCTSGVLNVSAWDLSGRLTGDYDFTLKSGTHLHGDLAGIPCSQVNAGLNEPTLGPE